MSAMQTIAIFGVLEELPEPTREALTRESIRRGVAVSEIIREALIETADRLNGEPLPEPDQE